jgi:hypothetical protein
MSRIDHDPFRPKPSLHAWAVSADRSERLRRAERMRIVGDTRETSRGIFRRLAARVLERRLALGDTQPVAEIRIRSAEPADRVSLLYLALAGGSEVVPGPLLVAEIDGRLRAAASLSSHAWLVDGSPEARQLFPLLQMRADQLREHTPAS